VVKALSTSQSQRVVASTASGIINLDEGQQKGAARKELQKDPTAADDLLADLLPHFFDPRA
jgi:hypothetical protein